MGKMFSKITEDHQAFIEKQKLFFVGTAAETGSVNISPKGLDSFRIIDNNTVIWLNLTGSGNETAAHLLQNNRMTIMFCAFDGKPLILRLYGKANIYHPRDAKFKENAVLFKENAGSRQIIELAIDRVQTSCGFAVPLMQFTEDRDMLTKWTDNKGSEGIQSYWENRNQESIDGFDTEILRNNT